MSKAVIGDDNAGSPAPSPETVRAAVERILASKSLAKSPRMTAFLRHVVEETLAGRESRLKEYSLAIDVFERDASFDPQTSPIVRVQAGKLRRMLALYYAEDGRDDPLRIDLPKGSYVPVWTAQAKTGAPPDAAQRPAEPPPALPSEPERRQLTVLQCDTVNSAMFTEQLGVEGAFEVLRDYQRTATDVVKQFAGHMAYQTGDGFVAYFGYPQAHEDAAERAVRSGLRLIERLADLQPVPDISLQVRIGIATGVVVAGDILGDSEAVIGSAPKLAASLQTLAEPNQIVIGPRTYRLTGDAFECTDLGVHEFQEFPEAVPAWRICAVKGHDTRFEAAHPFTLPPVHGRDQEIALLLDRWGQAKAGEGQVVLLAGEAGIGKSRVLKALTEAIVDEQYFRLHYQCSPYYANTALHPLINRIERDAQLEAQEASETKLRKLESLLEVSQLPLAEVLPPIATLLGIPTDERYAHLETGPERHRELLLNALLRQILGLARIKPVLLVLEDVHWIDATTRELAEMTIESLPEARILLLVSHRHEFQPRWDGYPHVTVLSLNRLGRRQSAALMRSVAGDKALPREIEQQILDRSDGVPLFIEELTKTVLESDALEEQDDQYRLTQPFPSVAVPATLQDSLTSRLDRLARVKEVAQTAAAIGREFDYDFLGAVSEQPGETLDEALLQLTDAGLIFRRRASPQPTFIFKHALVQQTAYQSMLQQKRKQLHGRIARIIQADYPETLEAEPELLAHHATEAGLAELAIEYWDKAAYLAGQRSANVEAAHHLTHALQLLDTLPDSPERARRELRLQLALGSAEMKRKGYATPEVEQIYLRAQALCRQLGDPPDVLWAVYGAFVYHLIRCQLTVARKEAERIDRMGRESDDPVRRVCADIVMGDIEFFSGNNLSDSKAYYAEVLELYDRQQHGELEELFGDDPSVIAAGVGAIVCWMLGFPDQGLQWSDRALSTANDIARIHSVTLAHMHKAWLLTWRREAQEALKHADEAVALCSEHGFSDLLGWTTGLRGAALSQLGRSDESIAEISQEIAIARGFGMEVSQTWFCTALAEAYLAAGNCEEALGAVDEAFAMLEKNAENVWEPELHRVKGDVLTALKAEPGEVEQCYTHALERAAAMQLKSLELRSAMSLCRMQRDKRKKKKAGTQLSQIYEWFGEGFDTPDLVEAKSLLNQTP